MLWINSNGEIILFDNGRIADTDSCPCSCPVSCYTPNFLFTAHVGQDYQFQTVNDAVNYIKNTYPNTSGESFSIYLHGTFDEDLCLSYEWTMFFIGYGETTGIRGTIYSEEEHSFSCYFYNGKYEIEADRAAYRLFFYKAYVDGLSVYYDTIITANCCTISNLQLVPEEATAQTLKARARMFLRYSVLKDSVFNVDNCYYQISTEMLEHCKISNLQFADIRDGIFLLYNYNLSGDSVIDTVFENITTGNGSNVLDGYGGGGMGGAFNYKSFTKTKFKNIILGNGGAYGGGWGAKGGVGGHIIADKFTDCEFTAVSFGNGGECWLHGGCGGGMAINNNYCYYGCGNYGADGTIENCKFDGVIFGNGGNATGTDRGYGGGGGGIASGGRGRQSTGTLTCIGTNEINNVSAGIGGTGYSGNGANGVVQCP